MRNIQHLIFSRLKKSWILVIILAVTFIAFSPVLKNGFTNWDDDSYVLENKLIKELSYSNVKKIEQALDALSHKQEQKASDVMGKKIISVKPNEKIKSVIEKMKKHGISQVPVIDNQVVIGTISETALLYGLLHEKGNEVNDVMEEAPPVIGMKTRLSVISNLLQFSPMVLVSEKGKLKGVITKADVLSKIKI